MSLLNTTWTLTHLPTSTTVLPLSSKGHKLFSHLKAQFHWTAVTGLALVLLLNPGDGLCQEAADHRLHPQLFLTAPVQKFSRRFTLLAHLHKASLLYVYSYVQLYVYEYARTSHMYMYIYIYTYIYITDVLIYIIISLYFTLHLHSSPTAPASSFR